jgi:hypothetical protein
MLYYFINLKYQYSIGLREIVTLGLILIKRLSRDGRDPH